MVMSFDQSLGVPLMCVLPHFVQGDRTDERIFDGTRKKEWSCVSNQGPQDFTLVASTGSGWPPVDMVEVRIFVASHVQKWKRCKRTLMTTCLLSVKKKSSRTRTAISRSTLLSLRWVFHAKTVQKDGFHAKTLIFWVDNLHKNPNYLNNN